VSTIRRAGGVSGVARTSTRATVIRARVTDAGHDDDDDDEDEEDDDVLVLLCTWLRSSRVHD